MRGRSRGGPPLQFVARELPGEPVGGRATASSSGSGSRSRSRATPPRSERDRAGDHRVGRGPRPSRDGARGSGDRGTLGRAANGGRRRGGREWQRGRSVRAVSEARRAGGHRPDGAHGGDRRQPAARPVDAVPVDGADEGAGDASPGARRWCSSPKACRSRRTSRKPTGRPSAKRIAPTSASTRSTRVGWIPAVRSTSRARCSTARAAPARRNCCSAAVSGP